jgi:hypothetical protein
VRATLLVAYIEDQPKPDGVDWPFDTVNIPPSLWAIENI